MSFYDCKYIFIQIPILTFLQYISLGYLDFLDVGEKCARFLADVFSFVTPISATWPFFPRYVAYVLRRSRFDTVVAVAAMVLLKRYREAVRVVHDTDLYRLFFASFIAASKSINQRSYKLRFWFLIGGGIFPQDDILDIVQDFCSFLNGDTQIDQDILIRFVSILHHDAGFHIQECPLDSPPPVYDDIHRDIKLIPPSPSVSNIYYPHSILP